MDIQTAEQLSQGLGITEDHMWFIDRLISDSIYRLTNIVGEPEVKWVYQRVTHRRRYDLTGYKAVDGMKTPDGEQCYIKRTGGIVDPDKSWFRGVVNAQLIGDTWVGYEHTERQVCSVDVAKIEAMINDGFSFVSITLYDEMGNSRSAIEIYDCTDVDV